MTNLLNTDTKTLYFSKIGPFDALTAEQEKALSEIILKNKDNPESKEFIEARNTLVEHNLKLVPYIAKRYYRNSTQFADIIQSGNMGLMYAASNYDYHFAKFSTHASYSIKSYIHDYLRKNAMILSVPQRLASKVFVADKNGRQYEGQGYSNAEIRTMLMKDLEMTEKEFKEVESILPSLTPLSLDAEVFDGDRGSTFLGVHGEYYVDEEINSILLAECIQERLKECLTEDELKIINSRFGLNGSEEKSLLVLGKEFGITQEAIRQRTAKILYKLRHFMEDLKDYV